MSDTSDIKVIRLVPDKPFHNNVDLAIMDFGGKDGNLRQRGKITVDYAEYDIKLLKEQGTDTIEKAVEYYKDSIYKTVRRYLLSEFRLENGWDEVVKIIEDHIKEYY